MCATLTQTRGNTTRELTVAVVEQPTPGQAGTVAVVVPGRGTDVYRVSDDFDNYLFEKIRLGLVESIHRVWHRAGKVGPCDCWDYRKHRDCKHRAAAAELLKAW